MSESNAEIDYEALTRAEMMLSSQTGNGVTTREYLVKKPGSEGSLPGLIWTEKQFNNHNEAYAYYRPQHDFFQMLTSEELTGSNSEECIIFPECIRLQENTVIQINKRSCQQRRLNASEFFHASDESSRRALPFDVVKAIFQAFKSIDECKFICPVHLDNVVFERIMGPDNDVSDTYRVVKLDNDVSYTCRLEATDRVRKLKVHQPRINIFHFGLIIAEFVLQYKYIVDMQDEEYGTRVATDILKCFDKNNIYRRLIEYCFVENGDQKTFDVVEQILEEIENQRIDTRKFECDFKRCYAPRQNKYASSSIDNEERRDLIVAILSVIVFMAFLALEIYQNWNRIITWLHHFFVTQLPHASYWLTPTALSIVVTIIIIVFIRFCYSRYCGRKAHENPHDRQLILVYDFIKDWTVMRSLSWNEVFGVKEAMTELLDFGPYNPNSCMKFIELADRLNDRQLILVYDFIKDWLGMQNLSDDEKRFLSLIMGRIVNQRQLQQREARQIPELQPQHENPWVQFIEFDDQMNTQELIPICNFIKDWTVMRSLSWDEVLGVEEAMNELLKFGPYNPNSCMKFIELADRLNDRQLILVYDFIKDWTVMRSLSWNEVLGVKEAMNELLKLGPYNPNSCIKFTELAAQMNDRQLILVYDFIKDWPGMQIKNLSLVDKASLALIVSRIENQRQLPQREQREAQQRPDAQPQDDALLE